MPTFLTVRGVCCGSFSDGCRNGVNRGGDAVVFVAGKDKILSGADTDFVESTVAALWPCHDGDWPADTLFCHAINS